MTTRRQFLTTASIERRTLPALNSAGSWRGQLANSIKRSIAWIRFARPMRRSAHDSTVFDDRMLADMGLSRGNIEHAVQHGRLPKREECCAGHSARGLIAEHCTGEAMTRWIRLVAAGMLIFAGSAEADESGVAAPKGALMLVETNADGVQIYACEAKDQSFAWVFKGPEATLFDKVGRQIGTHFAGPSWKASDGSLVVGEVADRADAPDGASIPWLLLRAKSHDGAGALSKATFIRRAETKGGAAPKAGCDAGHAGDVARMRYSAVYQFFAAAD